MDDLEKLIKDSQEEIKPSEVNNAKAIYDKANVTPTKKPLPFKLIFVNAFILLLALGFFVIGMVSNKSNKKRDYLSPSNGQTQVIDSGEYLESDFVTFSSEEELKSYLSKTNTVLNGISGSDTSLKDEAEVAPNSSDVVTAASPTSYYQTNTREANVDEADIVKVNSNYIFFLSKNYNRVQIYKHSSGSLEFYHSILFPSTEEQVSEDDTYVVKHRKQYSAYNLYLTEKYVIVQVQSREGEVIYLKAGKTDSYSGQANEKNYDIVINDSYRNYQYKTEFLVYDSESCELLNTIDTVGSNYFTIIHALLLMM